MIQTGGNLQDFVGWIAKARKLESLSDLFLMIAEFQDQYLH